MRHPLPIHDCIRSMSVHGFRSAHRSLMAFAILLALAACGDDGRPAHSDGGPVDAGAERREAGPPIMIQPVSNTPNAVFRQTVIRAPDLLLLSSNLVQAPSKGRPGEYFRDWHGEIANNGSKPACLVQVNIGFQSSGGETLASFEAFAEGDAHESSPTHTFPCIAPGQSAGAYTIGHGPSLIALDSVAAVDVSLDGLEREIPRSSLIPELVSTAIVSEAADPTRWGVAGTAKAVGDIWNATIIADGIDSRGLIVNRSQAFHLESWTKGSNWDFQTRAGIAPAFERFLLYTEFLPGVPSAPGRSRGAPAFAPDAAPNSAIEPSAALRDGREMGRVSALRDLRTDAARRAALERP
jgi:hypothetical protein